MPKQLRHLAVPLLALARAALACTHPPESTPTGALLGLIAPI